MVAKEPTGNRADMRGSLWKRTGADERQWVVISHPFVNKNFPLQMGNWFILLPCLSDVLQDACLIWQLLLSSPQSISTGFFALQAIHHPFQSTGQLCMSSFKGQKIHIKCWVTEVASWSFVKMTKSPSSITVTLEATAQDIVYVNGERRCQITGCLLWPLWLDTCIV